MEALDRYFPLPQFCNTHIIYDKHFGYMLHWYAIFYVVADTEVESFLLFYKFVKAVSCAN